MLGVLRFMWLPQPRPPTEGAAADWPWGWRELAAAAAAYGAWGEMKVPGMIVTATVTSTQ
jgi:hypothetical protein